MNRELEVLLLGAGLILSAYGVKKNNAIIAAFGCIFVMSVVTAEIMNLYNEVYYKVMLGVYK